MCQGSGETPVPEALDALESSLDRLGAFGVYQCFVLALVCAPTLLAATHDLSSWFIADEVPFRCAVPECEGSPESAGFSEPAPWTLLPPGDRCRRFVPLPDLVEPDCLRDSYHQNDTIECDLFVYENLDTIFAEFGLACRSGLRALVGSARHTALPLALLFTGYVADTFGRRTAFCVFSAGAGVLGIVKGFSVNYQMYETLEFFEAALGYGFNSAGHVMILELARPSLRACFACATGVSYALGGVLLALVSSRTHSWRRLLWTVHTPALLLPLCWLLLDESPRWQYARARYPQAERTLQKAARWNKITLNEDTINILRNASKMEKEKQGSNPWAQLVKSRLVLVRLVTCGWCWAATTFVRHGLGTSSVPLSTDKHVDFALSMTMSMVSSLLMMMALERIGRRWSIFAACLISGFACVTPFFIRHSGTGLGLQLAGKLSSSFACEALRVHTAELSPTCARCSVLAACSLVARLSSVLAPHTTLLSVHVQALVYGACSALAGLGVLLVPETRRRRLPRTVRDAELLRVHVRGRKPTPHHPFAQSSPNPRVLSADT